MDAVKFLEELKRMCDSCEDCRYCPLASDCNRTKPPAWWETEYPDKMVTAVEKWSYEHSVKTRLMDFLEKFPNAIMVDDGLPLIAPYMVGYCKGLYAEKGIGTPCSNCKCHKETRFFCWNLPLEE